MPTVNASEVAANATSNVSQAAGQVSEVWMIIGLLSTMLLLFFVAFVFLTPIGKESVGRWLRKKKFSKGGYTNALMFTKDGLCKEIFQTNNNGYFNYNNKPYVRVPKLSFPYKGIPTMAYIEDSSSPIDIYDRDRDDLVSANELDTVMNQQMNFDVLDLIRRYKFMTILILIVIVGLLIANIYFGYNIFEWIRDSAPAMKNSIENVVQSKVA